MKYLIIFLAFFSSYAQEEVPVSLFENVSNFIGVDNTNHIYYIKNNTLYKKTNDKLISYANIHLGTITSVDITNPLKIVVFFKDFNVVVILDNELNELTDSINFTSLLNKNVTYVGTATNANLWLFSNDDNTLHLWNYKTKKVDVTIPLQNDFKYEFICSNYRNIWLISKESTLHYNEYGSFIELVAIKNLKKGIAYKNGFVYLANEQLIYYNANQYKNLLIVDNEVEVNFKKAFFYIVNDTVYFFDGKSINLINL